MQFLVDENLSPTLVELAHERGYVAMAVRDLGLLNAKDWTLLERIQNEDWTLVTNNVDEFRKRYARKAVLHAGAIFPRRRRRRTGRAAAGLRRSP